MAREKVTFKVNLRQNKNSYTSAYGHYYAEPDVNEPLNLKGFARHHCRAHPLPIPFALSRPSLHHSPRTLRPVDAALPRYRGTPRLTGHCLVPQRPS